MKRTPSTEVLGCCHSSARRTAKEEMANFTSAGLLAEGRSQQHKNSQEMQEIFHGRVVAGLKGVFKPWSPLPTRIESLGSGITNREELQVLNVVRHVRRGQYIVDQHQRSDQVSYRALVISVSDAGVC